jgi:tRNA-specific 2-thiouridylase
MFHEYKNGRTPNPDVLCNREIKFDVFLKAAMNLGADFVATGHYCRSTSDANGTFHLKTGVDNSKDQSYFLCQLNQYQLSKSIFPIGNLEKKEVRKIAEEQDLITANKKDSQGLCFVGKISLPTFLQQQLEPKNGVIIEIPNNLEKLIQYHSLDKTLENIKQLSKPFQFKPEEGIIVANHIGAHYYTIGQRKGLHIGGRPNPSFVIQTDTTSNIVFSGQLESHLALNRWALRILPENFHPVNPDYQLNIGETYQLDVKIRYRQEMQQAKITRLDDGIYILFDKAQKGISSGQFAVLYKGDELVASGEIYS